MPKTRVGNKENSQLNGERVNHAKWWLKRWTAKKRRRVGKTEINERQNEI